jgi:hypothetical protein
MRNTVSHFHDWRCPKGHVHFLPFNRVMIKIRKTTFAVNQDERPRSAEVFLANRVSR